MKVERFCQITSPWVQELFKSQLVSGRSTVSPASVAVSDEEFGVLVTLRDGGQDAVVKVAFGPASTQFPGRRAALGVRCCS